MKRMLLAPIGVLLGFGILAAGDAPPATGAAKEELAKLQGTWQIVSAEAAGKPIPAGGSPGAQLIIKGDKMVWKEDGKVARTWSFTVDPSRKKAMDWILGEEKALLPSIYALEGDELRICFPLVPKKGQKVKVTITRPENFDTKDKPVMLLVTRRVKP